MTGRHVEVAAVGYGLNACIVLAIGTLGFGAAPLVGAMSCAGLLGGLIMPSRDMLVRAAAPPGAVGRTFGIVTSGFNIGGMIGPLMFGFIMDRGAEVVGADARAVCPRRPAAERCALEPGAVGHSDAGLLTGATSRAAKWMPSAQHQTYAFDRQIALLPARMLFGTMAVSMLKPEPARIAAAAAQLLSAAGTRTAKRSSNRSALV
jgi:MFS family permease